MPELPEVETTVKGIRPHLAQTRIVDVVVRNPNLRWPVPADLSAQLIDEDIEAVSRRGKYILISTSTGVLLLHLGMSGSLRILPNITLPGPHDHVDIMVDSGNCLRLHDPRRFGCVLWAGNQPQEHPLLRDLGPEPLEPGFSGQYLYQNSQRRKGPVKNMIMDSHLVVGIGNIYASESLFLAGIHPRRSANRISLQRYEHLAAVIKQVLGDAISAGGTTLRDFTDVDGSPGYFSQTLNVYGLAGEPCMRCQTPLRRQSIGQRSSYYCPVCQT